MNDAPLVSVIIPTKNSAQFLYKCLPSVKNQTYPSIEIIVVDAYSRDETRNIAEKYGAKIFLYGPQQSEPFAKVFGAPYQRNYGNTKAKGKYIYYMDSDMRLIPTVIEECIKKIEKEKADAVIVPEVSFGEGFWACCRVLERACYHQDDLVEAARFIRKEVWDKIGGLDASLGGGDDWDLQWRLNEEEYKTVRVKSYVRHYEGRLSLIKQLKKKLVYGKTVENYFKKHRHHPIMLIKQYTILRPAYFRNWKALAKDPIHTMGFLMMKTCEYGAAFIGFLISRLEKTEVKIQ